VTVRSNATPRRQLLFLSGFFPSPGADSAGVLDAHHILRELSREHEITLLSFATQKERLHSSEVEALCKRMVLVEAPAQPGTGKSVLYTGLSFASRLPAIARMTHSAEMIRAIRREIARTRFDLALVEFTQMAHYVEYLNGIPAILDESDIAFVRRQRFAATVRNPVTRTLLDWDNRKLRAYEIGYAGRHTAILVRTETDKQLLRSFLPHARIEVFPPWIDLSFAPSVNGTPAEANLLFYGAMWRPANEQGALYFAEQVLPLIRQVNPSAEFFAVGSRPSKRLSSARIPGMTVTGFVPSVEPYYQRAAVVVAPLRAGSGIKGKIVQALACGKPVVTTPIGAEGIPATEDDGMFVREDPRDFADCVQWLLRDKNCLRFREPARCFVSMYYNWHTGVARLQKLCLDVAEGQRNAG
jgi:glycosyltransferase involved in cell wall biosynthesis